MNIKIKSRFTIIAIFFLLVLSGCTTATYNGFVKDRQLGDQYSLKVYIGGFSGGETADDKADMEIKKFMKENKYSSYKVLDRQHNYVPSYFEYTVKFYKNVAQ